MQNDINKCKTDRNYLHSFYLKLALSKNKIKIKSAPTINKRREIMLKNQIEIIIN
jgi:hypothetical protein